MNMTDAGAQKDTSSFMDVGPRISDALMQESDQYITPSFGTANVKLGHKSRLSFE